MLPPVSCPVANVTSAAVICEEPLAARSTEPVVEVTLTDADKLLLPLVTADALTAPTRTSPVAFRNTDAPGQLEKLKQPVEVAVTDVAFSAVPETMITSVPNAFVAEAVTLAALFTLENIEP